MIFKIARLKRAIRRKYRCRAEHVDSRLVVEQTDGAVWRGQVEIFELLDHPQVGRCYGWFEERGGKQICQVKLKVPPVTSPQKAVRAALRGKRKTALRTPGDGQRAAVPERFDQMRFPPRSQG